jgi:hypothetical protein
MEKSMSYFLTLRTGLPDSHQFSPRYIFATFEEASARAECASVAMAAEYLIEDDGGPVIYRLKNER